jgi:U3 small nucleolar RNA-associated protein 3
VRKRKKEDRNPRVKLRNKYEKAKKKRAVQTKEFQTGPSAKYGGEASGVKGNLIKSTKF